ncbi:MAG: hypothetical protein WBO46_09770 [Caldilineaceae bacterium]
MSAAPTHSFASTTASESNRAQIAGLGFDWLMIILSTVFVGGLFLDGWAHNHGKVDQSFFTPWHAFFYSGFLLTAAALVGAVLLNRGRGYSLSNAIPTGYRTSLFGLFVFAAGGVGDLAWHSAFGIEEDVEALFSPTHLLLGIGLTLVVTGPLRSAWNARGQRSTWSTLGPALLSTSLFISVCTFFMLFSHPVTQVVAGRLHRYFNNDVGIVAGMLGLIVIAGLLVGPVLLLLGRWSLPAGSLTLIWGLNTAAMTIIDYEQIEQFWLGAAMLGAAVLCDLLLVWLRPSRRQPDRLRIFAFAAPLLLFGAYFAALMMTEGTRWSIHLWSGSIFLTGIAGLLLSYLLIPPRIPVDDSRPLSVPTNNKQTDDKR